MARRADRFEWPVRTDVGPQPLGKNRSAKMEGEVQTRPVFVIKSFLPAGKLCQTTFQKYVTNSWRSINKIITAFLLRKVFSVPEKRFLDGLDVFCTFM